MALRSAPRRCRASVAFGSKAEVRPAGSAHYAQYSFPGRPPTKLPPALAIAPSTPPPGERRGSTLGAAKTDLRPGAGRIWCGGVGAHESQGSGAMKHTAGRAPIDARATRGTVSLDQIAVAQPDRCDAECRGGPGDHDDEGGPCGQRPVGRAAAPEDGCGRLSQRTELTDSVRGREELRLQERGHGDQAHDGHDLVATDRSDGNAERAQDGRHGEVAPHHIRQTVDAK